MGIGEIGSSITYPGSQKTPSAAEGFRAAKESFEKAHELTSENIKKEDDWRKMTDKDWEKVVDHVDKYIDAQKEELERLKELQEEAAMKMAAEAPADMRSIAASKASLDVAATGISTEGFVSDESTLEKESWTYEMATDDQTILATAKMANEYADDMITKSQEIALTDETTVGISNTGDVKECASLKDKDEEKKTWIITAFTEQGIMCKECTKGGESRDLWNLEYKNPGDCKKVWDFLARFDKDADLKFSGTKSFWEDFLAGKISDDELSALVDKTNAEK